MQRQAVDQLQQIQKALTDEPPPESPAGQQAQQPQTDAEKEQQRAAKYVLAQLKLVRALQQQLNRETELHEQAEGPWDVERMTRQRNLVQRQREPRGDRGTVVGHREQMTTNPPLFGPPTMGWIRWTERCSRKESGNDGIRNVAAI